MCRPPDPEQKLPAYRNYLREPTAKELLHGTPALTQFGRMCQRGIQIIAAGSPQAKRRVERNHGTHQDRLVKKLRRRKIAGHQAVNQYRWTIICPHEEPSNCARLQTERVLGNDWVVWY